MISPIGDALLLAGLLLPFLPISSTLYLSGLVAFAGCPADAAQSCIVIGGLDLNALYAGAAALLASSAKLSAGSYLLIHMCLLALIAQFTTRGFRGRIVRTCAVVMWTGVLPLILGLAAAIARSHEIVCAGATCEPGEVIASVTLYGQVFFRWLTTVAVPLAVMVTGLLALTLGYRALIGRLVQIAMPSK